MLLSHSRARARLHLTAHRAVPVCRLRRQGFGGCLPLSYRAYDNPVGGTREGGHTKHGGEDAYSAEREKAREEMRKAWPKYTTKKGKQFQVTWGEFKTG